MQAAIENPQLRILHVLTLNGRNGEYGGPVRVARELCAELSERGHSTHIFSGAHRGSEPQPKNGQSESYVYVRPITRKLPVSSLWSWKLVKQVKKLIQNSDLVHIHFARDLIPFLAAFLAMAYRKPFITQTHGMIISDGRMSTRLTDLLLTRPLINRSKTNLVLTEFELSAVAKLKIKSKSYILPNGIAVEKITTGNQGLKNRVGFCSRLDKRKGIDKFIELAYEYRNYGIKFDVYGPDAGELDFLMSQIASRELSGILEYKGALQAAEVQPIISDLDILVLPSKDEPFPMVVLEALAVGTPVLVMPSCGFSNSLRGFNPDFVAQAEDLRGLTSSFENQRLNQFKLKSQEEIRTFCRGSFGISAVVDKLLNTYRLVLANDI